MYRVKWSCSGDCTRFVAPRAIFFGRERKGGSMPCLTHVLDMATSRGVMLWIFFMIGVVMIESFAPSSASRVVFHRRRMSLSRRGNPSTYSTTSLSTSTSLSAMSAASSSIVASTLQSSLHGSNSFVLSALLVVSSCGITMERTTFGKALSAPLVTMLLSLCMANLGILPFNSNVYNLVNQILVPLAVPLFLFDSDLYRVVRDAGSLLVAFFVGSLSTVIGTLGALYLIPMKSLGEQSWKVACALTARHIGGAINFVAVADTLNIDGTLTSAAIAADNVVVALYFAFLFWMAIAGKPDDIHDKTQDSIASTTLEFSLGEEIHLPTNGDPKAITTASIAHSIATASCLVTIGSAITAAICPNLSSLVITSLLTVVSATIYPSWFERLRSSGTAMGILFLQMFFAASGAGGSLLLVLRQAPSLIAFSALQLAIHFVVLMGVGRGLLRLDTNELYLASNANVGGPTTAAAMAQAKEWKLLVLPALLVGVLGYALATALSLSLGPILIRLASR